jgi:selenide,water dikinase
LESPDDAAVWRLDETRALVMTTDFFTPVVDDAYDYGAIAAANSLSDVYAMGGRPFLALNLAALPPDLPAEICAEILRGGGEKARQAGVVIAGGHTIQDQEPKFGLVVLGLIDPRQMLTKSGARPGDRLFLTKPLGFGMVTTALKRQQVEAADLAEAVGWMTRLNEAAGKLAVDCGLRGATDITGYSLLGHGWEVAAASGVGLRLSYAQIPFLQNARHYAEAWTFPGGASDNRLYFQPHVDFAPGIDEASQMTLFDPQTSGGLLLAVPAEKLSLFHERAAALDQPVWEIGEVTESGRIEVVA